MLASPKRAQGFVETQSSSTISAKRYQSLPSDFTRATLSETCGKDFRILKGIESEFPPEGTCTGCLDGRKGGAPADRVLNAMPLAEITRYLRRTRRLSARPACDHAALSS